MYQLEMYTYVGPSGSYCPELSPLIKEVADESYWYYARITDESGIVIFEDRRPYFVRNCRPLRDECTGEGFMTSRCFKNRSEAELYGPVIELRNRCDYLDI